MCIHAYTFLHSITEGGNGLVANVQNFLAVIGANANALNLLTIVFLLFIDVEMIFNGYLKHVTI